MKRFFTFVFLMLVVGVVAAAVASIVSKSKFEKMSDEEIRAFLAEKLAGRVGDEQLGSIQDAVIAGVRRGRTAADDFVEEVEEAVEDLAEVAGEAEEELDDGASSGDAGNLSVTIEGNGSKPEDEAAATST